jgi:hypothetical protein
VTVVKAFTPGSVLDIDDSYKNAHKNNVVDNIDGFLAVV